VKRNNPFVGRWEQPSACGTASDPKAPIDVATAEAIYCSDPRAKTGVAQENLALQLADYMSDGEGGGDREDGLQDSSISQAYPMLLSRAKSDVRKRIN